MPTNFGLATPDPCYMPSGCNYDLQFITANAGALNVTFPDNYIIVGWLTDPFDTFVRQDALTPAIIVLSTNEKAYYIGKRNSTTFLLCDFLINKYIDPSKFAAAGVRVFAAGLVLNALIYYITPKNYTAKQ